MAEWVLVKWGGSLITDKTQPDSLHADRLAALARELAAVAQDSACRLLLGHGGGSFGHTAARESGLNRGSIADRQWTGVARTQERVAVLHRHVIGELTTAGLQPFSLVPSSYASAWRGTPELAADRVVDAALETPLLPVTHGDVVLDRDWGASIASTEALFGLWIERILDRGDRVRCAVWMGETDGVVDATGRTIPALTPDRIETGLQALIGPTRGADVTGGMELRLKTAARWASAGVPSLIVNGTGANTLRAAIEGQPVPGTGVSAR